MTCQKTYAVLAACFGEVLLSQLLQEGRSGAGAGRSSSRAGHHHVFVSFASTARIQLPPCLCLGTAPVFSRVPAHRIWMPGDAVGLTDGEVPKIFFLIIFSKLH